MWFILLFSALACWANETRALSMSLTAAQSTLKTDGKGVTQKFDSLQASASDAFSVDSMEQPCAHRYFSLDIPHKTMQSLPLVHNFLNKISFSWAKDLLATGNRRALELPDLWTLSKKQQMHTTSHTFQELYDKELQRQSLIENKKSSNILHDFWASPITRAIVKMYKKQFLTSGLIKGVNSAVQFLPAILVSRILKLVGKSTKADSKHGLVLATLLFLSLSAKTVIENLYFDIVTNLAAQIRGTLSASIYQKALRLGPEGRQNVTLGEIVNYMQIDTGRLEYEAGSIHTLWDGIFQIMGYTSLLLFYLGPAVFAGILAMLFIIPFNAYFLHKLSLIREENLKVTDNRVKLTNEIFQGIRAIKSYNWEKPFQVGLESARTQELKWIKAAANVRGILIAALFAAPSFVAVFSLATYAFLGNTVDPAKVFTSLALFNQLRFPLTFFPLLINSLAEGKISLQRLTRFFYLKEVEGYVESIPNTARNTTSSAIAVENGHFGWSAANQLQTNQRSQLNAVNLQIKEGELVAIIGPTGCGKTALLSALLGEMVKVNGSVSVVGQVAYVPQSPWIPNDSLKNVVLFGRSMESRRYFDALRVCGLLKDLDQMPGRDETEIGERGTNLSGGQKQRTSLARAVYEDADVYLLDDPLSALDNEVGFDVFRDCIKVALRKKTRILVTHNLNVLPDVDRIVLMAPADAERGCRIVDQGTLRELLLRGYDLASYVQPTNTAGSVTTAESLLEETRTSKEISVEPFASLSKEDDRDLEVTEEIPAGYVADDTETVAATSLSPAVLSGSELLDCIPDCVVETILDEPLTSSDITTVDDAAPSTQQYTSDLATGGESGVFTTSSILTEEERSEVLATRSPVNMKMDGTIGAQEVQSTELMKEPSSRVMAASQAISDRWVSKHSHNCDTEYAEFMAKSAKLQNLSQASGTGEAVNKSLMTKEERGEGALGWDMYRAYLSETKKPLLLFLIVVAFVMSNVSQVWQQWIVAAWTSDVGYVRRPLSVYLAGVALMATAVASFTWLRSYIGIILGSEASKHIHAKMVHRVLRAPLSFFESTPIGRLIQRFSKDLDQIDQQLPGSMSQLISSSLNIASSMMAICLVTPSFAFFMIFIFSVYFRITNYYRPVARELKRLDSLSRSPIYSHFSETLNGLPLLRAFQRQEMFRRVNEGRLDDNLSAYFALKVADRWLSFRLETLGNCIVLASAVLAVLSKSSAGSTGLSLTNALGITGLLNWAVRNAAETESMMNSVERVYFTIRDTPQEAPAEMSVLPSSTFLSSSVAPTAGAPAGMATAALVRESNDTASSSSPLPTSDSELHQSGWPWKGGIVFENVTMRYRSDFAPVLRGVSLQIHPGERIGIVGRTGSGKSSLLRGLQRLSELDGGNISIDGVDISKLGIDVVRQSMSIIPQDPVLFSDTIRNNLDPYGHYADQELWDALHKSNLGYLVQSLSGGLQYMVTEGGENFSSGQRQLLCLARALVRRSKILLLDEATSSVDFETDALIQRTIRREFHSDVTVLTIAHRLETVLDADRIIVIHQGRVEECDAPAALLRNPSSLFTQLVQAEKQQEQNRN